MLDDRNAAFVDHLHGLPEAGLEKLALRIG
jgi:hypothetical protein